MKHISIYRTALLALTAVAATACTADLPQPDEAEGSGTIGQQVTITAIATNGNATNSSTPGGSTRISYTPGLNGGLTATWAAGDVLNIMPVDGSSQAAGTTQPFTLDEACAGQATGTFSGTEPTADAGKTIDAYRVMHPASVKSEEKFKSFSYLGQVQTGNDSRSHLSQRHAIITDGLKNYQMVDFNTVKLEQSSCMKFVLTVPGAAITPRKITLASADGSKCFYTTNDNSVGESSKSASLSLDLDGFNGLITANSTITAYLMMASCKVILPEAGLIVTIDANDGSSYSQTIATPGKDGKAAILESGKMHTITASQMVKVVKTEASMEFKVTVADDDADKTFTLPFVKTGISPAKITVSWGDQTEELEIKQNASLFSLSSSFIHTYAGAGTYTITITTSQTDFSQPQIPKLQSNNTTNKITSIDTPLLNTGAVDFSNVFFSYTALETLPDGLFDNNPQVTKFYCCFQDCTALKTLPDGLFDNNPTVTNFSNCFVNCTALKLNATIFGKDPACYQYRRIDFRRCFESVGKFLATQEEVDASIAPELWNYDTNDSVPWTTNGYFDKAKFSNKNGVPSAWGTPAN